MLKRFLPVLILLMFLLTACGGGGDTGQADTIATVVAATLQANASPTPREAPPVLTGFVSGRVCAISADVPQMTVFLQRTNSTEVTTVPIAAGDTSIVDYTAELPPGTYIAYGWHLNFRNGGSYSQLVACGFKQECSDHSLVTFEVVAGQTTEGVDVCDWYAVDQVPYPPGIQPPSD